MSDWAKRYLGWDHFPTVLEEIEIETFFTLGAQEMASIRTHRRDTNRLAIAIQIGYMRMTGVALNSSEMIPATVLAPVAGQLGESSPRVASIRALPPPHSSRPSGGSACSSGTAPPERTWPSQIEGAFAQNRAWQGWPARSLARSTTLA